MASVLVIAEQREGKLRKVSEEILSEGRRIADATSGSLNVVVIGGAVDSIPGEIARFGTDLVITVADERLRLYAPAAYARAAADAAGECGAEIVLAAASAMGRDLGARLAARLDAGLASDCTGLEAGADGSLVAVRPVYSSKAVATLSLSAHRPVVLTLRPNVFPRLDAPASGKGEHKSLAVSFEEKDFAGRAVEIQLPETVELDVTEADVVVAGGRAMKGEENFSHIRALAQALGGAVGASRAAVDAGWIDHRYQVGQTGKVVSPKLYIACGISGAIQHLAGMTSSKVIVAINKDADAPIFKIADYGLVGDLYALIPAIVEEVRKLKAS